MFRSIQMHMVLEASSVSSDRVITSEFTSEEDGETKLHPQCQLYTEHYAEIKKNWELIKWHLYLKALIRSVNLSDQKIFQKRIHMRSIANKAGCTVYKIYKQYLFELHFKLIYVI